MRGKGKGRALSNRSSMESIGTDGAVQNSSSVVRLPNPLSVVRNEEEPLVGRQLRNHRWQPSRTDVPGSTTGSTTPAPLVIPATQRKESPTIRSGGVRSGGHGMETSGTGRRATAKRRKIRHHDDDDGAGGEFLFCSFYSYSIFLFRTFFFRFLLFAPCLLVTCSSFSILLRVYSLALRSCHFQSLSKLLRRRTTNFRPFMT
jgi:hypothetical protein